MLNNKGNTKLIAVDLKNEGVVAVIPASELTTTTTEHSGLKITWSLSNDIEAEASRKRTPLTYAIKAIKEGLHSRYNALYNYYKGYKIDPDTLEELKRYRLVNERGQITSLFHYEVKEGVLTLYVMYNPLYCRENCDFKRLKGCKRFLEADSEEDFFGDYYEFDMDEFIAKSVDELVEGCECELS